MKGEIRIPDQVRVLGAEHDDLKAAMPLPQDGQRFQRYIGALKWHRRIEQSDIMGPVYPFAAEAGKKKIPSVGNNRDIVLSGKRLHQLF